MKHYKYGGSTAGRTIGCPAWIGLAEKMPKSVTSSYAEKGSMLHDCMEQILLQDDHKPQDCLGFIRKGVDGHEYKVDQDMIDNKIEPAHDAFKQLCKEYGLEEYEAETTMA